MINKKTTIELKINNKHYYPWILSISTYLKDFYQRKHPLLSIISIINLIRNKFNNQWYNTNQYILWKNMEQQYNQLYCTICDKYFSKNSVYQSSVNQKSIKELLKEAKKSRKR